MIINCGKRRIVSYTYGWKIEIEQEIKEGKKKGQLAWREDSPAWPASLEHALTMVWERELIDGGDTPVGELEISLRAALEAVRGYVKQMEQVRSLAA